MTSGAQSVYCPIRGNGLRVRGWLHSQARRALDGYVGMMPSLCGEVGGDVFATGRLGPESSALGSNVAGVQWWNGESEGNWLLAWASHALLLHDETAINEVERYLSGVIAAQDPDGYIGMFTAGAREAAPYIAGDLWTQSRVLQALQMWTEYRSDPVVDAAVDRALERVAQRFQAALESGTAFAPSTGDSCGRGHDLMIVEVLAEQARRHGDKALTSLAAEAYGAYSAADIDWTEADMQVQRLLSAEPVIGHGAHTAEHLRIPLLIAELHDESFLDAFKAGYAKILKALGTAGALKCDEAIAHPGSAPFPLPEAGYEYCAITELALSLLEAARVTGDFTYVDQVERLFLNMAQAGVANDGRSTAYLVAENQTGATLTMGTRWDYSPTHDDVAVCCPPNAGRLLPIVAKRMVVTSAKGVSIQLYGPMEVSLTFAGTHVRIVQETSFPFDEDVLIRVESDRRFEVELRLPTWCMNPSVEVHNAQDVQETWLDDRVHITAHWNADSAVTLRLPQTLRREATRDGRTTIAVGPLVYSVPIPHDAQPYRSYGNTDYHDHNIVPASAACMYPPILLDPVDANAELSRLPNKATEPWTNPPFEVHVRGLDPNPRDGWDEGTPVRAIRLVPIGCTTLRWTALHTVQESQLGSPAGGSPAEL